MNDAQIAYLNGEFLPLTEARVPVLDRGFLFGDGVYELIPAYGGRLFRSTEHLRRLQQSLDGIRLANPYSAARWGEVLRELVRRSGDHDQSVYLQVTRGVSPRRAHVFPDSVASTVFAMSNPLKGMDPAVREHGVRAITHAEIRWQYCHLKTISLLPNVLMQQLARDAGAEETLLVRDGNVTEGASCNVFVVDDGVIVTPPKSAHLLPGITRDLVLELARGNGLAWREADLPLARLRGADEVWITSSSREIMPVVRVDDTPIGDGRPGAVWRRALDLFEDFRESLRAGRREDGGG